MASVVLKNIRKVYPNVREKKEYKPAEERAHLQITDEGVVAVQDFNLEIADKEFVVLVGPSGCGKSTTLRMIAGLEEITSGDLYIDDERINDKEPKDRDIAMVFQNYALYPHMNVEQNMSYSLRLHRLKKAEIKKKVHEAAKILDIEDLLGRLPKELSGGQRQRVAIGRAIVRNPRVLLMDEPLSNLDAKLRNQMRAEIIKLRDTIDTTFVYVTHDQIEAMTLGDRIVVMKDGYIQQVGTPQEVFNHPKNTFVAGFIGTPQMNFFTAELLIKDDSYYVNVDGHLIRLGDKKQENLKKNAVGEQGVLVGVRPQHMKINDDGIKGTVTVREMMGVEVHSHLNIGGKDVILITDSGHESANIVSGGEICITFNENQIHIFSKEDKQNLEN